MTYFTSQGAAGPAQHIGRQEGASPQVLAVCPGMGLGCQWGMVYRKRLEKGLWGIRGERHRAQAEGRVMGTGPGKGNGRIKAKGFGAGREK